MGQTPTPRPPREPTGPPPGAYPYIRAWGRLLGSVPSYVREQIALAHAEGAPATAVYRTGEGTWATTGDITRADTRRALGLEPLPARAPTPAELTGHLHDLIGASEHLRDVHGLREVTELGGQDLRLNFTTGHAARLHLDLTGPGTAPVPARPDPADHKTPGESSPLRRPIRPRSGDHDNPPTGPDRRPT